jgi:membrane-associated protein
MGAILWVGSITLAGYFLGSNEWIQHNFEKVVLGIVAASLLPVVFQFIKHKLAK